MFSLLFVFPENLKHKSEKQIATLAGKKASPIKIFELLQNIPLRGGFRSDFSRTEFLGKDFVESEFFRNQQLAVSNCSRSAEVLCSKNFMFQQFIDTCFKTNGKLKNLCSAVRETPKSKTSTHNYLLFAQMSFSSPLPTRDSWLRKCYKMLKSAIKAGAQGKKYVKWRLICNQRWARSCLFFEKMFRLFVFLLTFASRT